MIFANNNKTKKFFIIAACALFIVSIISFAFAKPSFEVAPQSAPTVSAVSVAPATQDRGSGVVISATIVDVSGISYAKAEIKNAANAVVATVNLYDDGAHSDGAAGDNVYANSWTIPASFAAGNYGVFIVASDTLGYIYTNAVANANLTVTIPACTPSKTCADYPGQCGTSLSNGCANVLNCSGFCVAPNICCSGTCALPTCSNNSDCDDGDNCTTDTCNNPGTCSASCSNPSIVTCATGPNCRAAVLANASVTADVCCPGKSCYKCDTGFGWDGSACVAGCVENWSCTAWSACVGGTETRICTDSNSCGTTANKPTESQSCVVPLNIDISSPSDGASYNQGDNISFSSVVTGGSPPYSFTWNSNIDDDIGFIQNFSKSNLSVGAHNIKLTAQDSAGNSSIKNINVTVNCSESWSCSVWSACVGGNQTRTCTDNNSCGTVVNKPAESQGCLSSSLNITINSPSDGSSFADGDLIEFKSTVSGGAAPYTYEWKSNISDVIGISDLFRKDNLSQNTHNITLKVTNSDGISGSKNITIIIGPTECRPYLVNGTHADKMDVVFIRDYDSTPTEIEDQLYNFLYYEDTKGPYGLFKFEPVASSISKFNIYYYTKKRGGGCDFPFTRPDGYNAKCSFADVTVFPRSKCPLNMASFSGYFCFGFDPAWTSPFRSALVHENGHAMFQLADEYYGTPHGATFNLYTDFASCENKRINRGWDSLVCEKICSSDPNEGVTSCQNRWRLVDPADDYGKSCVMTGGGRKFMPDDQERMTSVLNNFK